MRPILSRLAPPLAAAALLAAPLAAPLAAEPAAPPASAEIFDVASGAPLSFEELLARVRAADLVVIGELHDQPDHQRMQAAILSGAPVGAAAFEMIPRSVEDPLSQARAEGALDGVEGEAADALQLRRWAPWIPPVEALGAAPVFGAGLEREALMRAMREGGAAAFSEDAEAYGLAAPLPEAMQAAMVTEQVEAHCNALPEAMAPGMVEVQRLRDAEFAHALLRAREAAGARPAALITGNGHARKGRGSPRYLAAAAPALDLLVIGQTVRRTGEDGAPQSWEQALAPWQEEQDDGAPVFDVLVIVDEAPETVGKDHCADLRKRQEEAQKTEAPAAEDAPEGGDAQ